MEKFEIKNRKGLKIVGEILTPKDFNGIAFVVHGLGGFKEQKHIKIIANTLFDNKYKVINFDTTNSVGESEGEYGNATMQNHFEDLEDVILWAKKQIWYKEPFILAGHSMGGYAVARYAEENPKEVKILFPFGAVFCGKDSVDKHWKDAPEETLKWKDTGWFSRFSNSKKGVELRLPWSHMEERILHNLKPNAKRLNMPVLFVVGSLDSSTPQEQQKEFFNLLSNNGNKEINIIENAPHTFKEEVHLEKLKNIFDAFLKKFN